MMPWSEGGQSGDLRETRSAQHSGADPLREARSGDAGFFS
jgi:hypothetical protein